MAIREDLVSSAVTFLQDPSVSGSPIENRIAFLQSKNLTQEEVDAALARASGESAPPGNYSNYAPQQQQQVIRQPQPGYGGYQQYSWQQPPPPEVPKRDWRDWFIMATVMGGFGYGLYFVAKRYVYPMIAPPTPPQLEQDKQAIDESFEKAFTLLDQLAKDTEILKSAETARTERLDAALTEVEEVISQFKSATRRREDEHRMINDEVRGLKDLIPKAMEGQKETTDNRLRELNAELKSLKTLLGQRMNPATASSGSGTGVYGHTSNIGASSPAPAPSIAGINGSSAAEAVSPKPASVSNAAGTESTASLHGRSASPFNTGAPSGKATIPAWQRAPQSSAASAANPSTPGGIDLLNPNPSSPA